MQQTDKYQLNLIESSDTFSPAPLNENAQKLEAALQSALAAATAHADAGNAAEAAARQNADAAEAQARANADAALDQRLQVFEAHKLVIGRATQPPKEYLGFRPRVLLVPVSSGGCILLFDGVTNITGLVIQDDGFYHDGGYANCRYIAFA